MGVTNVLHIAKLGLFANQTAMSVTSHNITNANTTGFSRQAAQMRSLGTNGSTFTSGFGVRIGEITRSVDGLAEKKVTTSKQEIGRLDSRSRFLTMIEAVFNEVDGEGLGVKLDDIFGSAEELADNPSSTVARNQFLADAESMVNYVQKMAEDVSDVSMPVDQEVTYLLNDINTHIQSLRQLNLAIIRQEGTPSPALDLKDQRQELLKELSGMIDVQYFENENGGMTVMTQSGFLLTEGNYAAEFLRGGGTTETGFPGIVFADRNIDITDRIQSGSLKGLLEIRDEVLNGTETLNGFQGWQQRLETFVDEVRWQFNRVHSQSVGDSLYTSQTGVFDLGTDIASSINTLSVDPTDPAFAGSPPDIRRVASGDVTIAFGSGVDNLGSVTFSVDIANDSIQDIVTKMNTALNGADSDLSVVINGENRVVINAANGKGYGVLADDSGIMAALGLGALFTGSEITNLGVNPELSGNVNLLGAGRLRQDDAGNIFFDDVDNEGALALAELQDTNITLFDSTTNFAGHYAGVVGDLGTLVQQTEDDITAQQATMDYMNDFRESVSGVSLDEEMINLIKFQSAYEAASRIVVTANEMLDSIMNMV